MAVAYEVFEPIRPPLKWAGGKRWLVPRLRDDLWLGHEHRRLVEPFVGGLAVTLSLGPRKALLNDANEHVVSFYKWLQRGLKINDPQMMKNDPETFARHRMRFNALILEGKARSAEAAALFYYLNRTGFNGLCRFNSSGLFNVPFGRYKTIPYVLDFSPYSFALQNYEFTTGDFEKVRVRPGDFIYADPPYDVEFTSYSAGGFSWEDQERLADWLAEHPGPVVASNQATKAILSLYRKRKYGFKVETLPAPRRISCDGNRDDALEMLATRNLRSR